MDFTLSHNENNSLIQTNLYIYTSLIVQIKEKQQQLVGCFVGVALRTDQSQIQSF